MKLIADRNHCFNCEAAYRHGELSPCGKNLTPRYFCLGCGRAAKSRDETCCSIIETEMVKA